MNFSQEGWLKHYLYLRNNYALKQEYDRLMSLDGERTPEDLLYELLQPSGLLYGHAATIPISHKALLRALRTENLTTQEKLKVILTESFLHSGLVSPRYEQISHHADVADALLDAAIFIGRYYQSVYPGITEDASRSWFRNKKKGIALSEYMINLRVESKTSTHKFWSEFFKSSLLFLDVLYFGKWLHVYKKEEETKRLIEAHQQMRLLIFQVIVAAAFANNSIALEEKQLMQYYLEVAMFDENTRQQAETLFKKGLTLENISLANLKSTVMKRHLLELAILTVLADREINVEEQEFLEALRTRLSLDKLSFESCMVGVKSFILEHWQQMNYLQDEEKINKLGKHLHQRMSELIIRHQDAFLKEIEKQPELHKLLLKSQNEKLSAEERNKIRYGLISALKGLPAFMMVALPKSHLTFPVLMKLLPDGLLTEGEKPF